NTHPSQYDVDIHATLVEGTNQTQYILTFNNGPGVNHVDNTWPRLGGTIFNILKSGLYELDVKQGSHITGNDGTVAEGNVGVFWTLYGCVTPGSHSAVPNPVSGASYVTVLNTDLADFGSTFGSSVEFDSPVYLVALDSNLDGDVLNNDF